MLRYARSQPVGFKNAIERVAIVGVSILLSTSHMTYASYKDTDTSTLGRRHHRIAHHRCPPSNRKTLSQGPHPQRQQQQTPRGRPGRPNRL